MESNSQSTIVYIENFDEKIKVRYCIQKTGRSPCVVIFPPNPAYGGNIDNKIVKLLEEVFQKCGFSTLAVNFNQKNHYNKNNNIYDHLYSGCKVLDWLQSHNNNISFIWITGYSFGAYIAADIAIRRPEIENFILVSPLVSQDDFSFMVPSLLNGLIVLGNEDQFIKPNDVEKFYAKLNEDNKFNVELIKIDGADHKYKDKTDELFKSLENYINIKVATRIAKPVRKKRRKRQKKEKSFDVFED